MSDATAKTTTDTTIATPEPTTPATPQAPSPAAPSTPSAESTAQKKEEPKPTDNKSAGVKYELKLPEGSLLDQGRIKSLESLAKENGWTNEQAQTVLNRENEVLSSFLEAQKQLAVDTEAQWIEELKSDKEIGGAEFGKNVELAHRVLAKYDSDGSLRKELDRTRLGNHPLLVKFIARIGKAHSEDSLVQASSAPSGDKKRTADILYNNTNK